MVNDPRADALVKALERIATALERPAPQSNFLRNSAVYMLHKHGWSYTDIAGEFDISSSRVGAIVEKMRAYYGAGSIRKDEFDGSQDS